MQLNELLNMHDLKHISQKTKISKAILESLFEKDFAKLKPIQAIGFISIVEREFDVELGELKKEAEEFYSEHKEVESSSTSNIYASSGKRKSRSKRWLIKLFVLMLIAFATWYFYQSYYMHKDPFALFGNTKQL